MAKTKKKIDILLIAPLELEMDAVIQQFQVKENFSDDELEAYLLNNTHDVSVVAVRQDDYGKEEAVKSITRAGQLFNFRVVICVGIAGSLSTDAQLGDVCYSKKIVDLTEKQKISNSDGEKRISYSPNHYPTSSSLQRRIDMFRTDPALSELYTEWKAICKNKANLLEIDMLIKSDEFSSMPGPIACHSAVISDSKEKERILETERKLLAVENESGGIFSYCIQNGIVPFSIRGISDFSDEGKKALEQDTKDLARDLAAHNAASFFKYQFRNLHFVNWIKKENSVIYNPLSNRVDNAASYLIETSDEIEREVFYQLQELSQEFRLLKQGYKVPMPRVEQIIDDEELIDEDEIQPIEIIDAIRQFDKLFLVVPESYPEASLPWMIAYHLLQEEIDECRVLPFVVEGNSIRPPRHNFEAATGRSDLEALSSIDESLLVFIVEEPQIHSKTRSEFLSQQINKFPKAKYIFIRKGGSEIAIDTSFSSNHGVKFFSLSRISFSSMVYFLQKNFGLQPAEAEVIAHRLTTTFDQFNLLAHPSYVAGIPREILASLIRANKRAELIELAVTGHLMVLVASDPSRPRLSRTTRLAFLELIAEKIHVDQVSLSYTDVIQTAQEFSNLYGYDLDAKLFVDSYFDRGILSIAGKETYFVFPFIEYYVLASVLVKKKNKAIQYFNLSEESDFDVATFDLYSELGPDVEVINQIISALRRHKDGSEDDNRFEFLVSDDERLPTMIKDYSKVRKIQEHLSSVIGMLRDEDSAVKRKQMLLDLAGQTTGRMKKEALTVSFRSAPNEKPVIEREVMRDWFNALVLLASGAEKLDAETKRELHSLTVDVGLRIAAEWTEENCRVDFEKLKNEIVCKAAKNSDLSEQLSIDEREKILEVLPKMVDLMEFAFVTHPLRVILKTLSDRTADPILLGSLKDVNFESSLENLVGKIILSEAEENFGNSALNSAVKNTPSAPLVRCVVASHLIHRADWLLADEAAVKQALNVVERIISPLGQSVDRDSVIRRARRSRASKTKDF